MTRIALASFLVLPLVLRAQDVSITFTTAAPLVARAYSSVSGQLQQQVVPGNQTGNQYLQPWNGNVTVLSEYGFGQPSIWHVRAECYEAAPAFAQATGNVLVHVSATAPVAATIELVSGLTLTAGATGPAFSIDYGDDGLREITEAGAGTTVVSVQLGPTPIPIRLRADVDQIGNGTVDLSLGIRVLPATAAVYPLLPGCAAGPIGPIGLFATPTFQGSGVQFYTMTASPAVLVFGLAVQPVPLPFPIASSCLLVPRPDLLVPVAVPTTGGYVLPLPQAVRPLTAFAQAIAVTPTGLAGSNSFTVQAY